MKPFFIYLLLFIYFFEFQAEESVGPAAGGAGGSHQSGGTAAVLRLPAGRLRDDRRQQDVSALPPLFRRSSAAFRRFSAARRRIPAETGGKIGE